MTQNQTLNRLKVDSISAVQNSTITLKQCFVESYFDVIVLNLHRWKAESV